jgi:hypothetical protein
MQIGNNQFEFRGPARVAALGDPDNFPTYADLLPFYQSPGAVNPGDLGKPATGFINTNLTVTGFNDYANDGATILVRGENNHGVAKAFVDFMNQEGLVSENGRYVRGQVYDPLFVFGLPVTGAYWVKTKVGGKELPILFQVFERRVLTYNPANSPQWRVALCPVTVGMGALEVTGLRKGAIGTPVSTARSAIRVHKVLQSGGGGLEGATGPLQAFSLGRMRSTFLASNARMTAMTTGPSMVS